MLDFTSSLYLGLRHASADLRPWAQLSTGVPAVLGEPPESAHIAAGLAALTGVERVTLARSTLHAFWDLFGAFDREPVGIFVDAGAYPIARWGAERVAARGTPLHAFRHHDATALRRLVGHVRTTRGRPWIVTDGFCTGCGRLAPLADYLAIAREFGGRVVIDDTQALGILGERSGLGAPYGHGGGGSLRATGTAGPEVLLVASLAKAFGAPLALVGGTRRDIARVEAASETRVHASPPSIADLRAAEHALAVNRQSGEMLRLLLAALVTRLQRGLRRAGLPSPSSLFPVQQLSRIAGRRASAVHRKLSDLGVRGVLRRSACAATSEVVLVITAAHSPQEIDRCVGSVGLVLGAVARPSDARAASATPGF